MFTEIVHYRHLLYMLTLRDIKLRYKETVMGFFWAIFMPMLIVIAGVMVKVAFSKFSGQPVGFQELASVTVKALPWSFFISSIRFSTTSLLGNSNLVTKIYFPREVFPIASTLANLYDFFIASVPVGILLVVMGLPAHWSQLWLPLLLAILFLFTIGAGLFLSCASLFFRDVKYIVDIIVTFAIFFTPVFYEASMFGKWSNVIMLNPVGAILESINAVLVLGHSPSAFWVAYSALWAVGGLLLSWSIFHKAEFLFAERI